jgi:hypothetical protein
VVIAILAKYCLARKREKGPPKYRVRCERKGRTWMHLHIFEELKYTKVDACQDHSRGALLFPWSIDLIQIVSVLPNVGPQPSCAATNTLPTSPMLCLYAFPCHAMPLFSSHAMDPLT